VGVNVRGGEGGIREVEKDYEGDIHSFLRRGGRKDFGGKALEYWRVDFTVGFTVHWGGCRGFGLGGLGHPLMS
jgi:hypothetical protein